MPDRYAFSTRIPVRVTDVNYAGHLGNDSLLSILHEARMQFLGRMDCSEFDSCGKGLIMADAALVYRDEAFFGDTLEVSMAAQEFTRVGFDLYYRVRTERQEQDISIANARTHLVFFDYQSHKKSIVPDEFLARIAHLQGQTP